MSRKAGNPLLDTVKISLRFAPLSFLGLIVHGAFTGLVAPLGVYAQRGIYDGALAVYQGQLSFGRFAPWLALLALSLLYPGLLSTIKSSILMPTYLLRIRINLRRFLSQKCFRTRYEHFEDPDSVDSITQTYEKADETLRHMAVWFTPGVLTNLIRIVGVSAFLVQAAWWLPITVVAPCVLNELLNSVYSVKIYALMDSNFRFLRKAQVLQRYMQAREYIKEMKLFRAFRWMSGEYVSRLSSYNRMYEKEYVKNMSLSALLFLLVDTSRVINVIILLGIFLHGGISVGLFIALAAQIFNFGVWLGIGGFGIHKYIFTHYYKVLGFAEDPVGHIATVPAEPSIEFQDVSFRYPGAQSNAVEGVSFRIKPQEKLSLVGENGAGKSTLVKLLLGLYEPQSGQVLVNGHPVLDYTREARAALFAPVFQDFVKYSLTLRESLALGSPGEVADDALLEAADKGGFGESARRLGLDQQIGKEFSGGTDLSGGEWQRLALSRAFVGDRPIVLLDEPTSQLDPMAEAELYRGFARTAERKTTLLVTHRLGATKITDRILVLHQGRLIEEGSHDELMAGGGAYARMYAAQRQWYQGQRHG